MIDSVWIYVAILVAGAAASVFSLLRGRPFQMLGGLVGTAMMATIVYVYGDNLFANHRLHTTEMRAQFHLGDDVPFEIARQMARDPCITVGNSYRAAVLFSGAAFDKYVERLSDGDVWTATPIAHLSSDVGDYDIAPEHLRWIALAEPEWMGGQQLVWNMGGHDFRRGMYFCYRLEAVEDEGAKARWRSLPCVRPGWIQQDASFVVGSLDFDMQRLDIKMQMRGRPAYCKGEAPRKRLNR